MEKREMAVVNEQIEVVVLVVVAYILLSLVLSRLGSQRSCGSRKAFLVSLFLTPAVGLIYVSFSHPKSVLKTVHYRCNHCGLEYTSSYRYCRICAKEGHKHRLHRISMKTY
jgi:hypothetical protein